MKSLSYWFLAFSLFSGSCAADDLAQIYQLALDNDPALQAAYDQMIANKQALPIAIGQMLPAFYGSYMTQGVNSTNPFTQYNYNARNYGFNLNLPLFHSELWAQLEQARHTVKAAVATYMNANQMLMLQVAEQYFAILSAMDDVTFTESQRKAFARELAQTRSRYEVGLIAITDVEDSKANHDRAVADTITTKNALANEYEKLRQIVGVPICDVVPLPEKHLTFTPPIPNEPEAWVCKANDLSLEIIIAKENAEQYKAEVGKQAAAHLPTVDVQGALQRQKNTPNVSSQFSFMQFDKSVTLNINVPIFAGGQAFYKTRQAAALYEQSLKKLEIQQRLTDSNIRQFFRNVATSMSSVSALRQVVVSNQNSLDATRAAYEVGTRTMVDVLNAETNLFGAKRDYAKARYQYFLEGLKLKQAAGVLCEDDLYAINDLLLGREKIAENT